MKIRSGFVSNSSSSSYVLFAEKKFFYDTLEKYKDIKPIIENLKESKFIEEINFLGKDVIVLAEWMDAGGGGPLDDFEADNEDLPDKIWDRYYNFKEKLEKNKDKCYAKELDW